MNWERARKPEQIAERREAILEAARMLFSKLDYDAISLNEIARQAGFSKPNVYRYFSTREEIFLTIFAEHQSKFVGQLKERISKIRSRKNSAGRIADVWVEQATKHPVFLDLLPQLMTSLEKNSSVDQIAEFKITAMQHFADLVQALANTHPQLSVEQWQFVVQSSIALMAGLWPMTNPSEKVSEAMERASMDHADWQFKPLMRQGILSLIAGTQTQSN